MIEVENLVKRYGGHLAVDHLSFTVEKGCVCGFLGPNGAGKSTTMNMMTGYLAPTEGEVRVDGHSVTQDPAGAKACIGYLPEQPPLYVDMTVREYLEFAAGLKRIPRGERAAQLDRILEMTRTADVSGRLIRNLSKGYRQRVGLAQALIGFPHILILDEPTVGLDPKQILEIRALIRELAQEHTPTSPPRSRRSATTSLSSTTAGWWPKALRPSWSGSWQAPLPSPCCSRPPRRKAGSCSPASPA